MSCAVFLSCLVFLCQPSGEALRRGLLLVVLGGNMCVEHRVVRYGHEGLAANLVVVMGGMHGEQNSGREEEHEGRAGESEGVGGG